MEGELLRVTDGPEAQQLLGRRKRGMPFELGSNRAATPQGPQGKGDGVQKFTDLIAGLERRDYIHCDRSALCTAATRP